MNERIVLCHGVFDLLHAGHVEHLQQARAMGDRLIVSVTADDLIGSRTPMLSKNERMANLRNLPCVDAVILAPGATARESILQVRPAIYVKGPDFRDAILDPTGEIDSERTCVESVGGAIAFTTGPSSSTTYLRARHTGVIDDNAHAALEEIRAHVGLQDLAACLHRLADARFLVVGDPIIDIYVTCETLGRGGKSPALSLRERAREQHAGGSWAIAAHLAMLVPRTNSMPPIAPEPDARILRKIRMFDHDTRGTAISLCSRFEENNLSEMLAEGDLDRIDEYDAVLVADFGHGLMHERARHQIESRARWLASMVQANSVNGGRARYLRYAHNRRPNYMCQNRREIAMVLAPDIMQSPNWARAYSAEAEEAAATMGHEGSWQLTPGATVRVPAIADRIVDTTGAGDAYYAASAAFSWACGGNNPWLSGLAGAVAAALQCRVRGNAKPITRPDFMRTMRWILMHRPEGTA